MICNWCGKEVQAGNQFCPYCGKPVNNQNNFNELNNNNNNNIDNKEQKANIGLAILSWFIPLAGLIIFIVKKDKEPKTAKVSGICALISFLLNLIIVVVSIFFLSSIFSNIWDNEISNAINDNWDNNYDYDYDLDYDIDLDYDNNTENNEDNNIVDNNQQDDNIITDVSSDWKKYEITVNNQTIKLPTTYNELTTATGYSFKSSQVTLSLASNYYTFVNMYKNDKLMLYTEIYNDTKEQKLYTDCKITRISQTKYQITNGATKLIFPAGLKVGDKITETELTSLLGTPNDIKDYSTDSQQKKIYKYYENKTWTTTNNFIITVINGEIDEIQLDNR